MPRFSGLTALKLALERAPLTPLIVVTGSLNEDTAVECMKAGAANYVIKEQIKRLGPSVIHALQEKQMRLKRLEAETALHRNEKYFRSLIENAHDMIVVLDAAGRIQFQSPSIQRRLGYAPDALADRCAFDFVHPEDLSQVAAALQQTLREPDRATTAEFRFKDANNSWRVLETVGKSMMGNVDWVVVINCRDVTERRQLEDQLRQAQKMEAIGQLASGVAHDFNNILTVILGNAAMLMGQRGLGQQQTAQAKQIVEAAERAAGLTRQLLLFSRKQVLQLMPLKLNDVVASMAKMLRRILGEDVQLQLEADLRLPLIRGDISMLEQVLLNLAVNARDAMPKGGRLGIVTTWQSIDETLARHRNQEATAGDYVILTVSDTGCGISPEHLPHIFEPFFTTKEVGKGTGLGLATVYGIVKQHRGWIEVLSSLDLGTTFRIFLPASSDRSAQALDAAADTSLPAGTETILIVEDEPSLRLLVANLLQSCGYTVWVAASGRAALEMWQEVKGQVQLLLTDIIMPDGITGRELADRLTEEKPGLKVIYTSGYSAALIGKDPFLVEGVSFLQKPYSPVKLARLVRQRLDAH